MNLNSWWQWLASSELHVFMLFASGSWSLPLKPLKAAQHRCKPGWKFRIYVYWWGREIGGWMTQIPVLHRDFGRQPLVFKFQQNQDPIASLFKTHLSWVEVQMGKEWLGNGDALAPEWYWVIETIRMVEELDFKNWFWKLEERMTGSDQPTTKSGHAVKTRKFQRLNLKRSLSPLAAWQTTLKIRTKDLTVKVVIHKGH